MYLLSSIYKIDVRVKLLVDDVWEAEDDKAGLLSFWLDFDWLSFQKRRISLPMVQNSNKNKNHDK